MNSRIADSQSSPSPERVRLQGWIGARVMGNASQRLARIDTNRLLEGYRQRPGRQTWDGEHVGKWLHAATLAWANTGDRMLRNKLDNTVSALAACQLEDGYLGTYLEKDRWGDWDVWAHKYNLIGLLAYIRFTGNMAPLAVCVRMGDLLCRTFGDEGAKRDILASGWHGGLASTSMLEPMVQLYLATGEARYLAFCHYLVRAWEQPNGPRLVSRLIELKRVDKVGDGKAYEMLSCLNGALELYRVTGDARLLQAGLNAWQDIVARRLYITGTASANEHFHDDFYLPNRGNVAETCVTVTWMQFNAHLLRLTGEARFAEQLERTVMNQLFGAQHPDCTAWGYYVEMEGRKPYSSTFDANCCLSSGPRGVASIPTFVVGVDRDGVVVNLYTTLQTSLTLSDDTPVKLSVETDYPRCGNILLGLAPARRKEFSLKLRVPEWATNAAFKVNGRSVTPARGDDGYAALRRNWSCDDRIELVLPLELRAIVGTHTNEGKLALAYGPLILAADEASIPSGIPFNGLALEGSAAGLGAKLAEPADPSRHDSLNFEVPAVSRDLHQPTEKANPISLGFVPFAQAGETGASYRVWMPVFGAPGFNLGTLGTESRSRAIKTNWGHPPSIIDGNRINPVVAQGGPAQREDWFAITLPAATAVARIVFYHASAEQDGGWFDATKGKPRIEMRHDPDSAWRIVGELANYPATTSVSPAGLARGERFELRLQKPEMACAVRVIGAPGGADPGRAYASCAELELFAE